MGPIAYLSNEFPSPVEPYVAAEIHELRARGVQVIATSARRPASILENELAREFRNETLYLFPLRIGLALRTTAYLLCRLPAIAGLLKDALFAGKEPLNRRLRALAHTWFGACYAVSVKNKGIQHIHVHHGYFSSWIAMAAARLLGVSYSMTLHGSDVLLHAAYMETKLRHCKFCITISEFNRQYILHQWPVAEGKVVVCRLGAEIPADIPYVKGISAGARFELLAVGRLHAVKNHAFLIRACRELKERGVEFRCRIAGEGPERRQLEYLIRSLQLENEVILLGHVSRADLDLHYRNADLVVLTSRSEGVPVVLMEAMSHGKITLAPAITGIPELVFDGVTGFLYEPGCINDFLSKIQPIVTGGPELTMVRTAARQFVSERFNDRKNLAAFGDAFLTHIYEQKSGGKEMQSEDSVLQQVQLSV